MSTYRGAYIYQGDRRLIDANRAIMAARTHEPDGNQLPGNARSTGQLERRRAEAQAREARRAS